MKNTLKKVVSVVSLIAFVLSMTVFTVTADATEIDATVTLITDVNALNDKLNITVTPGNSDKWVTVIITEENGNPLGVIQQAATTVNNIQFSLSGVTPAQTIKVKVSVAPSNKTKNFSREYFTNAQQQQAIQDIMDPEKQITEEIAKFISLELDGDIEIINQIGDDPTQIPDGILYLKQLLRAEYEGQSNIDVEQFVDSLNDKIEVAILSSKDTVIIENYMEREKVSLGISVLDEYDWYSNDFSTEDKALVMGNVALSTYDSVDKFVKNFKGQCFLQKLSVQYSSGIMGFLTLYAGNQYDGNEALALDFSAYNALEDYQKSYFETQITGIRHNTIALFKSDFVSKLVAAAEYTEEGGSSDGGSSGTSGQGGSLGSISGATNGGGNSVGGNVVPPSTSGDSASGSFKDISSVPWAQDAITSLAEAGVVHGVDGENFNPTGIITKEQFVQIVVGAFGLKHNGNSVNYADVQKNQWYSNAIEIAAVNGIVYGVNDTQFGLGLQITRQDMATIIYRIAKSQNIELTQVITDVPTDIDSVPEYAKEAVTALYQAGIIHGVGNGVFSPADVASRAQAAKIIYELWRVVK